MAIFRGSLRLSITTIITNISTLTLDRHLTHASLHVSPEAEMFAFAECPLLGLVAGYSQEGWRNIRRICLCW